MIPLSPSMNVLSEQRARRYRSPMERGIQWSGEAAEAARCPCLRSHRQYDTAVPQDTLFEGSSASMAKSCGRCARRSICMDDEAPTARRQMSDRCLLARGTVS